MQLVYKKGEAATQLLACPPEPSGCSDLGSWISREWVKVNPVDGDGEAIEYWLTRIGLCSDILELETYQTRQSQQDFREGEGDLILGDVILAENHLASVLIESRFGSTFAYLDTLTRCRERSP